MTSPSPSQPNSLTSPSAAATTRLLVQLIVPVYLPIGLAFVAAGMLVPTLPLYLADADLSLGEISLVFAGVGLGSLFGGLPSGEALARVGERSTMLAALVGVVVATAALGFTDALVLLVALRLLYGVAQVAMLLSGQTWITRRIVTGQRGRALSFIGGSLRVALLVGPFLGGVLVDRLGFRSTFVVASVIAAAGLVPASRSHLSRVELLDTEFEASIGVVAALRQHWRRLLAVGVVPALVAAAREGRFIVLPLIAEGLDLSATQIGALVAVSTGADLVLFPVAGWVMDRFGRLAAMVPAFATVAVGLVVLGLAGSGTAVVVAAVIMGLGNGLGSGAILTLGSDLAPSGAPGPFLAGMSVLSGLGRVIGSLLVGAVGSLLGLGAAAIGLGVILALAIAWLLTVIGESSNPDRIRSALLRPTFSPPQG